MTKDQIAEIAKAESGSHWGTEAHIYRIAMRVRDMTIKEAAKVATKFHACAADCAEAIRALGDRDD